MKLIIISLNHYIIISSTLNLIHSQLPASTCNEDSNTSLCLCCSAYPVVSPNTRSVSTDHTHHTPQTSPDSPPLHSASYISYRSFPSVLAHYTHHTLSSSSKTRTLDSLIPLFAMSFYRTHTLCSPNRTSQELLAFKVKEGSNTASAYPCHTYHK